MLSYFDKEILVRSYQDARLQEVERERLARQAQANRPKISPVYAPLLAKLGRQLVNLGEQLREQYEASESLVSEF